MTNATPRSRPEQILDLLTEGEPNTPLVERVCTVSLELLGVSGAGMCLVGGRQHQVIVHGTDALCEELEDLQVTLGQGPCIESVETGRPVIVEELDGYVSEAWPRYADDALARGVGALFTFPINAGGVSVGALDLYRDAAGALSRQQFADAVILTEIASRSMLAQRDRTYVDGSISALRWLTGQDRLTAGRGRAVDLGITVEQALAPAEADGSNDALGGKGGGSADRDEHT